MGELRIKDATRWDPDEGMRVLGLPPCFPRGITFADVDSETEINGQFLVIEFKRAGQSLSTGQVLTNFARWNDGRTVFFVEGQPPYDVTGFAQYTGVYPVTMIPADLAYFLARCKEWADWADAQPRPAPRPSFFRAADSTSIQHALGIH